MIGRGKVRQLGVTLSGAASLLTFVQPSRGDECENPRPNDSGGALFQICGADTILARIILAHCEVNSATCIIQYGPCASHAALPIYHELGVQQSRITLHRLYLYCVERKTGHELLPQKALHGDTWSASCPAAKRLTPGCGAMSTKSTIVQNGCPTRAIIRVVRFATKMAAVQIEQR